MAADQDISHSCVLAHILHPLPLRGPAMSLSPGREVLSSGREVAEAFATIFEADPTLIPEIVELLSDDRVPINVKTSGLHVIQALVQRQTKCVSSPPPISFLHQLGPILFGVQCR